MTEGHRTANIKSSRVFIILTALLLLAACSSGTRAPVQERKATATDRLSYHLVSKGETLYSIAWRYGLDYKSLAANNSVSSSYAIYPGQKIYLSRKSDSSSPVVVKQKVITNSVSRSKSKPVSTSSSVKKIPQYTNFRWYWPAKGKVVAKFSSKNGLNKGIDIRGELGESVIAAGPGVVVYAGSGLRGYGNLLIIKHSDRYLSAYAHNRRLLVKEQSEVKAGQKIAEVGSSGTDTVKLHFEIRRNGKPVDPLTYLPKR